MTGDMRATEDADVASVSRPGRDPQSTLRSLDRALRMLEMFTEQAPTWTLTELARATGLTSPTVRRLAEALRDHGYLERDKLSKRYRLGLGAIRIGTRAQRTFEGRVTIAALEQLAAMTGDTAFYVAPSRDRLHGVCLAEVEGQHPLRFVVGVGRQTSLAVGASQKALLAFLGERDRQRVLATLTDRCRRDRLEGQLEEIRAQGWAVSYGETEVRGTAGVAVPVGGLDGVATGAVCLAGPSVRFVDDGLQERVAACQRVAGDLAARLDLCAPPGRPPSGRGGRARH